MRKRLYYCHWSNWRKNGKKIYGIIKYLVFGYDIVVDSSDNIYITGYTESYGYIDHESIYLLKYDSMGIQVWNLQLFLSDYSI